MRMREFNRDPLQMELEQILMAEKQLTALWYSRISGETEWQPGERERMSALMDRFTREIRTIQLLSQQGMGSGDSEEHIYQPDNKHDR